MKIIAWVSVFLGILVTQDALATSPMRGLPKERLPVAIVVTVKNSPALPGEPLWVELSYRPESSKPVELASVEWDGTVVSLEGKKVWKANLRYKSERLIRLSEKSGFKHTVGKPSVTWRTDHPIESGRYKTNIPHAIATTIDGKEWLIEVENTEFVVQVPVGVDAEAWKLLKTVYGEYPLLKADKETARRVVDDYPKSVYAPYALFHELHEYKTLVERYPDHLLAPDAMVMVFRHRGYTGATAEDLAWLERVKKEHPDSDAAWEADLILEWQALSARVKKDGPTKASLAVYEAFASKPMPHWMKQAVDTNVRGLKSQLEEHGEGQQRP
jgi:hypothetical protein